MRPLITRKQNLHPAFRPALVAAVALGVTVAMAPTSSGVTSPEVRRPAAPAAASSSGEVMPNYDARNDAASKKTLAARSARLTARPTAGVKTLRRQLGVQGLIDIDPMTGTPRLLGRIDGFLTGKSKQKPAKIVRKYVRTHPDVFGLSHKEVAALKLRKTYKDIAGTRHLSFIQRVAGVPVFGNGLRAHVAKDGRLIQVDGSPLAKLPTQLAAPQLTAGQARQAAVSDVHGSSKAAVRSQAGTPDRRTVFRGGDRASLVAFATLAGVRSAWQTISMEEGYLHVIDAATGRTLYRQNLRASDTGRVWDNYPGAARGGQARPVNFTARGWLPNNSPRLAGNVAHVYKDLNDDDAAQGTEEVPPSGFRRFVYPLTEFTPEACVPEFVCTWDPEVPLSWQTNANQNAVQMFSFLGRFHDHLRAAPIGFTRAAGNFEAVDGDAVEGNAIDGANGPGGVPDGNHVDNANMATPPDGMSPLMQMYVFHQTGTLFPDEDPFIAANSGDEADIVYHEYGHGLSNRLVVDVNGISTLNGFQAVRDG